MANLHVVAQLGLIRAAIEIHITGVESPVSLADGHVSLQFNARGGHVDLVGGNIQRRLCHIQPVLVCQRVYVHTAASRHDLVLLGLAQLLQGNPVVALGVGVFRLNQWSDQVQ